MILQSSLTEQNIIIIAVVGGIAGLLLLIGIFFLIQKVFLAKRKCEKIISGLERSYEYYHSLLIGQDAQYIHRLELISRTNLLFADIHSSYFRRLKEIRDNLDIAYQEVVNNLRDLHADNEVKEFKKYYNDNLGILKKYEESVEKLNSDLAELIRPEEEARQNILALKEKFREVKSKYNINENELTFMADSFQKVFDAVDRKFLEYDNYVESAIYEDAKKIIPDLDKVLDTLIDTIQKMPDVLKEVNETLPDRVRDINEEYEELVKEGFPLKTFNILEQINQINYELEKVRENIINLRFSKVDGAIEKIHNELDSIVASFDEEKNSRQIFEQSNDEVTALFNRLERSYIKISNKMPKFKKGYVIDKVHEDNFEDIRMRVDGVGKEKRKLEIYIHSMGTTPYKLLVEKMHDLDRGTKELDVKLNAFKEYLGSLKTDTETAYKLIKGLYVKITEYENIIDNNFIKSVYDNLKSKVNTCYDYIDEIYRLVMTLPINVLVINETINKLTDLSSAIFNEVDSRMHNKKQAMKTILVGNRERTRFSDVNSLIEQAESFYLDGDYKRAFELGQQALSTLKTKEGNNI